MPSRVEVVVVAGPRGPAREPLRARVLSGAVAGEAAALCTDDPAWDLGCGCCELRGALFAALGRLAGDPRLRRLLIDVADETELAAVLAVVQSPYLARVLEFVGLVGFVRADDQSGAERGVTRRSLARLRRAALILIHGDAALVARVRSECPGPRVLTVGPGLEAPARILVGGGPGRGLEIVRDRPVALSALEVWLDALPAEVARVDGDALVAEWPGRRAVVRKLGGLARISSAPRDGLAETRLWAVARDRVALGAP